MLGTRPPTATAIGAASRSRRSAAPHEGAEEGRYTRLRHYVPTRRLKEWGRIQVDKEKVRRASMLPVPMWERYAPGYADRVPRVCRGDQRLGDLVDALSVLDQKYLLDENGRSTGRSAWQKEMNDECINACLGQMYGEELHANLPRLMRERGISELRTDVLGLWPRRTGKTVSTSMFATAVVATQPGVDVLIYSTGERASKSLLDNCIDMIPHLIPDPRRVKYCNQEVLAVYSKTGHLNKIKSYPASGNKLRGTGNKEISGIVICEEIFFMDIKLFFSIIAPILVKKNVVLIMLSSHESKLNFAAKMCQACYPDGTRIIRTLEFDFVCDDCKMNGKFVVFSPSLVDIYTWHRKGSKSNDG